MCSGHRPLVLDGGPQRRSEQDDVLIAVNRILRQATKNDGTHLRTDGRRHFRRRSRLPMGDGQQNRVDAVPLKRLAPGEERVGNRGQRPLVRPRSDTVALPQRLLGGHVLRRPQNLGRLFGIRTPRGLRDPEVEHLHEIVAAIDRRQHDVVGLEIAVDDPALVRGEQGARHLLDDAQDLRRGQGTGADQPLGQELTFDELHHQKGPTAFGHVEVDDLDDVRVAQRRGDLRLLAEARLRVRVVEVGPVQKLHSELPGQAGVVGRMDLAASTLSDWAHDPVRAGQDRTWAGLITHKVRRFRHHGVPLDCRARAMPKGPPIRVFFAAQGAIGSGSSGAWWSFGNGPVRRRAITRGARAAGGPHDAGAIAASGRGLLPNVAPGADSPGSFTPGGDLAMDRVSIVVIDYPTPASPVSPCCPSTSTRRRHALVATLGRHYL